MYQYCPKCKELIQDGDTCPECGVLLEITLELPTRELSNKEKWIYITGYLLLVLTAFWGRDLTQMEELTNGAIILLMFTAFSIFWYYIRGRGGLGWPPTWGF